MATGVTEAPPLKPPSALEGLDVARELMRRLFNGIDASVAVELADGTPLFSPDADARSGAGAGPTTIVVRSPGVLRALLTRSSDLAAGEAAMRGDLSVRGDLETAFAAMDAVAAARNAKDWIAIVALAARLPRLSRAQRAVRGRGPARLHGRVHSLARDRAASAYHYDISNEFYALWLDKSMTYTCAYYPRGSETLDEAQHAKHDHICRKLRLRAGDRVLDIGCGWGAFIRFAVQHYGVTAVGVTLSDPQAAYARERIEAEGLAERCRVELCDYRELAPLGTFDKIASIGMVEAVGEAMIPRYFQAAFDALRPGGLFLNHGIITERARGRGLAARFFKDRSRFIESYVFPDGALPRLEAMVEAAQDAGFEVRDIENLREHYVLTLRNWIRRLEAHETEARAVVGDEAFNTWRFYMAGSAHSFSKGHIGLVQMLLAKRLLDGRVVLPATRADMYART